VKLVIVYSQKVAIISYIFCKTFCCIFAVKGTTSRELMEGFEKGKQITNKNTKPNKMELSEINLFFRSIFSKISERTMGLTRF